MTCESWVKDQNWNYFIINPWVNCTWYNQFLSNFGQVLQIIHSEKSFHFWKMSKILMRKKFRLMILGDHSTTTNNVLKQVLIIQRLLTQSSRLFSWQVWKGPPCITKSFDFSLDFFTFWTTGWSASYLSTPAHHSCWDIWYRTLPHFGQQGSECPLTLGVGGSFPALSILSHQRHRAP